MKKSGKRGKGTVARGPTAKEFESFVRDVRSTWDELGENVEPVWSWDNASIHRSVRNGDWHALDIGSNNFTQLTPYSPDIHSVIEISHSMIMSEMRRYIRRHVVQEDEGLEPYGAAVQRIFLRAITPAYIKKLTHRLFFTVLPAIIERDGGWGPKHLR